MNNNKKKQSQKAPPIGKTGKNAQAAAPAGRQHVFPNPAQTTSTNNTNSKNGRGT